jgi:hypothetical protein
MRPTCHLLHFKQTKPVLEMLKGLDLGLYMRHHDIQDNDIQHKDTQVISKNVHLENVPVFSSLAWQAVVRGLHF